MAMPPRPRLIIATRNAHKTAEIRGMIAERFDVLDVTAFPECPEIEETGTTFPVSYTHLTLPTIQL